MGLSKNIFRLSRKIALSQISPEFICYNFMISIGWKNSLDLFLSTQNNFHRMDQTIYWDLFLINFSVWRFLLQIITDHYYYFNRNLQFVPSKFCQDEDFGLFSSSINVLRRCFYQRNKIYFERKNFINLDNEHIIGREITRWWITVKETSIYLFKFEWF